MNVPTNVFLELSSKCVCACPKCPRTILKGLYKEKDIPIEFVEQSLQLKPKRIYFLGNLGDPIFHSQFPEIIKMCDRYDQPFNVHTVGSAYNEEWWRDVYNSYTNKKSHWIFTLDGLKYNAGTYRKGLVFDKTFDAMKIGAELGKNIEWQYIVFKHNQDDIDQVKDICKDLGIKLRVVFNDKWDNNDPYEPTISEKDFF